MVFKLSNHSPTLARLEEPGREQSAEMDPVTREVYELTLHADCGIIGTSASRRSHLVENIQGVEVAPHLRETKSHSRDRHPPLPSQLGRSSIEIRAMAAGVHDCSRLVTYLSPCMTRSNQKSRASWNARTSSLIASATALRGSLSTGSLTRSARSQIRL